MKHTILRWRSLHKWTVSLAILIAMGMFSQSAQAQEVNGDSTNQSSEIEKINAVWPRFEVYLGGFFAGYNTGLSVGLDQLGAGIQIDLEEALGLNTSGWVFRGEAGYNFGKTRRHSLMMGYFAINRSATKVLEDSLTIDDIIYPIGEEVSTQFDFSIIRLKYGYAFLHDDRVSLSVSGGFFILPLNFAIQSTGLDETKGDIIAPLPVIGISIEVALTKKLYFSQSSELLYLATSTFQGSILDLNFRLAHKTFKHFGFGLEVNSTQIEVNAKSSDDSDGKFVADAKMGYTGVAVSASFYF
jgi:hypothetical protein